MAYNKENNQAMVGRNGHRPSIESDVDLWTEDNEEGDLTIDNPIPDEPEECECIYSYHLTGYFRCTYGLEFVPGGQIGHRVITGWDFFGREIETAKCYPPDHDDGLEKPGDYYIETDSEENYETCTFSIDHFETRHLGKCDICFCSRIACASLSSSSENTPIPSLPPDYPDQLPNNTGNPLRFFWHLMFKLQQGQGRVKGCCGGDNVTQLGAVLPEEELDHIGIPMVDRLKSYDLAIKGQRSLVTSGPPTQLNRSTLPFSGKFVMKDLAGNFIKYYVGDTVTYKGSTYRVIKATAGTNPRSDSASFQFVGSKS